jgi:hypothetical protein
MKKQSKQRDVEPKQNSTPEENRPSVSDETKQKLVKQYADRAEKESSKQNPVDWGYFNSPKFGSPVDEEKQIANNVEASPSRKYGADRQTIAEGSIDPNIDTVYRVGADDPYGYYSQAQLNNNMSGNDANAIYQATHSPNTHRAYGSDPEYNDLRREEGYRPFTAAQSAIDHSAYVAGAGAPLASIWDDALPAGVGSSTGIPREYLESYRKHLTEDIDRDSDWYNNRKDWFRDWMDNGRRYDLQEAAFGAPSTIYPEYDPSGVWGYNSSGAYAQLDPENEHPTNDWTPRGEALGNNHSWEGAFGGNGVDMLNYNQDFLLHQNTIQDLANAMSDTGEKRREMQGGTNLRPNMLYGYGEGNMDYGSVLDYSYDFPEFYYWMTQNNINTEPYELSQAAQLIENANDYYRDQDLQRFAQGDRDRQLYGDALMELMAQRQAAQQASNNSLVRNAIDELRHQEHMSRLAPRRRNITGSAVW